LFGPSPSCSEWPDSFSAAVNFPPHRHFVHDVGAFQLGIGATLLLATIWTDAVAVALAGYLVGGIAHTAAHAVDTHLGGSTVQTWSIGLLTVLAAVALVGRLPELGWVVGNVRTTPTPALTPFVRARKPSR
jgi:hypothetical protein